MGRQRYRGQVSVSPELLAEQLPDGETVFLHLGTEQYFGLDEVGTRMWALMSSGSSLEEVHGELLKEYDVEPDRLGRDLDELVEDLLAHGFIEIRDP